MRSLPARRSAAALLLATGTVLATAVPAFAHVTVQPGTATQGGYTAVAFRVPDESDTASTVKLEVTLPSDHPIASVSTQPLPGWTVQVDKAQLATPIKTDDGSITNAVSKITWTADSTGKIGPGQFQEFKVSLGPLPTDTDQLVFKALQTKDDGTVVRWIDEAKQGQPEPAHPAPVLHLTPGAAASAAASPAADSTRVTASQEAKGAAPDDTARTLGVVGIAVGVIGAALGLLGLRRKSGSAAS
ncbi:YcnI family protein [Kitasatospora sp. RB6PN24]|uniref:YcnI family copper-binding membrane protein n=1 Tax=Kitasatospora humi TaxID=2893891 RepID=UPI001E63599B|nr:YcnI family protein [Kitasatospora humi]MCC9309357.1 YcnI family protein [Kitasatospora humi]